MTNDSKWLAVKHYLAAVDPRLRYNEREVWRCAIGHNIGFEEKGKGEYFERPVLVIKKFNEELFIGIPLTTRRKTSIFYYPTHIGGVEGAAILSQVRAMDAKRLLRRIGRVTQQEASHIKRQLVRVLGADE